tara:strand:- start:1821 stop:2753 length:933 start_codon:yes stop_codon:yes gene_type:complete
MNAGKGRHSLFRKITLFIPFIILFQYNCSKNEIVSETITETIFVTKKDAYLYGDVLEKNIIDEIPAFIKIKTKEKIILLSKSDNDKIYYKTNFNNNQGWVESIYLAEINKDKKKNNNNPPTTKLSEKKPNKKKRDWNYFVQIASFKNKNNANKLVSEIIIPQTTFSIEKINTDGGKFFRVVTGIYNNRIKTDNILKAIKNKYPSLKPIVKTNKNTKKPITKQKPVYDKNRKTEYYTIQISSFENKTAAEKLAKKMTRLGYPSIVNEAWVRGKTWFRVQHGEYKMIAEAKLVSNKIKNKFKFDPWISNIYK